MRFGLPLPAPGLRGSRPRMSGRSASSVADGHLAAFEDHGHVAPPAGPSRHLGHRGTVVLHVLVHHPRTRLLVVPTSIGGVGSAVLSEDRHVARHASPPLERAPPPTTRSNPVGFPLRPWLSAVGCAAPSAGAWTEARRTR